MTDQSLLADQIYHSLREKLDTYALGFPATASGVEIEILRKLFTVEEAELDLNLSIMPEPLEVIAARAKRDPAELAEMLAEMIRKGTVFKSRSAEGGDCFHAAPWGRGFSDHNAGDMDPELAKLFAKYETDGWGEHFARLPLDSFVRFIPVGEAIDSTCAVAPYNKIEDYLRSKPKIAGAPCLCRDISKSLGEPCELPTKDACFVFDWLADYCVERGQARYLSIEEALELQRSFEEAGLVNMPTNVQTPLSLCHCDGDSCLVFRALKASPKPAEMVVSDFYMQVDSDECNGCEACLDRCLLDAIAMADSPVGTVKIDLARCIGCGICVSRCPLDALKLLEKREDQKGGKPIDVMEFDAIMSKYRGIPMAH